MTQILLTGFIFGIITIFHSLIHKNPPFLQELDFDSSNVKKIASIHALFFPFGNQLCHRQHVNDILWSLLGISPSKKIYF